MHGHTYINTCIFIHTCARREGDGEMGREGQKREWEGEGGREKNAEGRRGENERVEVLEFTCD